MKAYQRKTEKFFVIEEKKFGRIDSRIFFLSLKSFVNLMKRREDERIDLKILPPTEKKKIASFHNSEHLILKSNLD